MARSEERRANYGYWLPIASRWADCDAYGHVNNAMYYNWFDTALTTMLIERGVLRSDKGRSIGLCIESHCDFLAPISFPQTVDAGVRIGKIGNKSLRYEIALFPQGGDNPAAVGWFVHVFVDPANRQPIALTEAQKAAVADLEVCRG
jgi:acyl-CoA thioester hydrolase